MPDNMPVPPANADQDPTGDQTKVQKEVPSAIAPETGTEPPLSSHELTCKTKRDVWDHAKFAAELIGLGFLIAYTIYTAGIYCANRKSAEATQNTFLEIQKQTLLQKQQLIGTQAAIVDLWQNTPPELSIDNLQEVRFVRLDLENSGHVTATSVQVRLEIARLTLPNENKIGNAVNAEFMVPSLAQEKRIHRDFRFFVNPADTKLIFDTKQTIRLSGTITYNNGFDQIIPVPICFSYLAYTVRNKAGAERGSGSGFQRCEELGAALQSVQKEKIAALQRD